VTIEDSKGSDVTTAAIACLAHSTSTDYLSTSTDLNSYVTVGNAAGAGEWAAGGVHRAEAADRAQAGCAGGAGDGDHLNRGQ
jgi:hypothetical protein